jgi:hypothetical protein
MHHGPLTRGHMENENEKPTDSEELDENATSTPENREPSDEVPVPIAMSAAEIDERAQAVEALRQTPPALSDDDLQP